MRAGNISFRKMEGRPLKALYLDEDGKRFFALEVAGFANDPDEQSVAVVVEDDGHLERVSKADGFVCIVQPDDAFCLGIDGQLAPNLTSVRILGYAYEAQDKKNSA